MLNFMDHRLKPKITCDCVCEDDYPVENLVNSAVPREFIAYSVLKPPISINVQLVCRIYVNCVKIWAKVGSLKSTAFELSGDGQILGYGKCEQDSQIGVYFHNSKESPVVAKFTPILLKNCRKPISNLKVTVRKTKSCAVVIKRIEIWGQPAEKCPEVENLAGSSRSHVQHFEYADSPPQEAEEEVRDPEGTPEDFLDALTCHIMSIPFTLPSGKIIDERTLERCGQAEAEWGRAPSDPFTGLEYNRTRRPIFNAALKARIDNFLLTNSDNPEYKDTPRTVGTYIYRQHAAVPGHSRTHFDLPPVGSSFESTLKAAVESLKKTPPRTTMPPKKNCQVCEKQEHLYEIIKCKHLICRNCLLGSKEVRTQCTTTGCNTTFSRNDVVKYHVNR